MILLQLSEKELLTELIRDQQKVTTTGSVSPQMDGSKHITLK